MFSLPCKMYHTFIQRKIIATSYVAPMKIVKKLILALSILIVSNPGLAQSFLGFKQSPRQKISINSSWKFYLGEPEGQYYKQDIDDSAWETIHLPHTLKLTSINLDDCQDDKSQATFQREVGWYRRNIFVALSNRKVFLEFEGAHQVTDLWVNGQFVGQHAVGGYTPFHFDITDFIKKGADNQITLLVDNRKREDVPPDPGPFDYIKFSGLYRDVYQVETAPIRIPFNWETLETGVTFTTPSVDPVNGNATISIKTAVKNESASDKEITVVNRLIDKKGQVVLRLVQTKKLLTGQETVFNQIGGIENDLQLWTLEVPYLYRLNTLVYEGENVWDGVECKVGIRKFEHHPREGFLLNGQPIKLIGMNRHQHHAYIGDALPNSLHRKDILQLKELGFNIVRTAHYPQDDALIEACDELGMLVYEEPPTWINIGNEAWFDNLEKATRTMVRNHRNHPSVVIWGAGINHRGYVPRMHLAVKQEDPTRLTASQSSRWTGWQTSGLTDIYGQMVYGPVEWKRHEPMLAMEGRDGIKDLAPYKLDPLLTGIIAWTAHHYYTFHPPQKNQRGRERPAGIMSLFRYPLIETNFYPIELKEEPQLYIATDWAEGVNEVIVYSNAPEVELLVNNKTIVRKPVNKTGVRGGLDHPPFRFPIDQFEAGSLTAKAWFGKQVLAEQTVYTPSEANHIKIVLDSTSRQFTADGSDIILAYAYIVDKNEMILREAKHQVAFSIQGPASIIGDGKNIGANPMETKDGIAVALIQAGLSPGLISLKASAKGLQSGSVSWKSTKNQKDLNLANTEAFYDLETIKVDLGASDQLAQFDWEIWNGQNDKTAIASFEAFGGFEAKLQPGSTQGFLRWLGEMNVMGKYGYAIGEGVLSVDEEGLLLEFNKLPKGTYHFTSYHHAPRSNTDSMDPNKERLKTLKITEIPYAKNLQVKLQTKMGDQNKIVQLSEGKILPETGPGQCSFRFESDGKSPVSILFSGKEGQGNIWLNAFELKRLVFE